MRILFFTTGGDDYLQDSILYGLKKKFGKDVVDYPQKKILQKSVGNKDIYGRGFTLYGNLPYEKECEGSVYDDWNDGKFDITIFGGIYRQQYDLAYYRNYGQFKNIKTKWAFLDGEDDGFGCIADATHFGTYFKRENPFNYPGVKIIGLSIPAEKMLLERPQKTKTFTTHVQCRDAYLVQEVIDNCTENPLWVKEGEYYNDLAKSKYGITMKKSGWDVPRQMENAAHFVVNCIYNRAWDNTTWADKPKEVHPLGLVDMENCIIWDTPDELVEKIRIADTYYDKISKASRDWASTKTCEYMTNYFLKNI